MSHPAPSKNKQGQSAPPPSDILPPPFNPNAPALSRTQSQWGLKVKNTTTEQAQKLSFHVVFSIDISGSMQHEDAFDRNNVVNGANLQRFEAAKRDALRWMGQLQSCDRLSSADMLLFGEKLYEHRNIRSVSQMKGILDEVQFEKYTRTDLALAAANRYFEEDCKKYGDKPNRPAFFNPVLTDGDPTAPGIDKDSVRNTVAELIVKGTDGMKRDQDRTTLIIQYGSTQYSPDSDVSKFLAFLDDSLQEMAEEYFRAKYPQMTEDELKNLYDACDTGKQCQTWEEKDPERKMPSVNRQAFWDDDISLMFDIAISD